MRAPTLRLDAATRHLDEDLVESRLKGEALPRRLRNFRPSVDRYVASLGGPPPYVQRLKLIAADTEAHFAALTAAWHALAAECGELASGGEAEFASRWRALAHRWSFVGVNELIERHNRYYPAEARLAMDPRTGDFVPVGGRPYRQEVLNAAWVLERFPPSLTAAVQSAVATEAA